MKRITVIQFITLMLCIIFSCTTLEAQVLRKPGNSGQTGEHESNSGGRGGRGGRGGGQFGNQFGKDTQSKNQNKKDNIRNWHPENVKDPKSSKSEEKNDTKPKGNSLNILPSSNKSKPDTIFDTSYKYDKPVCYAEIKKKNGWFEGIGEPLTPEQASHLGCYFKLSRKNKAKKWTFVEAFDGYGNPSYDHNIVTYLVNPNDEDDNGANPEWKEKLQSVCKWAFISDDSGETVIQELAMDADSSTVFIFTPLKVGEKYLGSYTDKWGDPIYLRTDEFGDHENYASRVLVSRDKDGRDSLIQYIDDKGSPQKDYDGVFMTQMTYDRDDHQVSEVSLNIFGERMNNKQGYCSLNIISNDNFDEVSFFDADNNPVQLIGKSINSVYGVRTYFDEFGRDTTIVFIDANGKPGVSSQGIHKIRKKYNSHGQKTFVANYDLDGNLCAEDPSGVCQVLITYDNKGQLLTNEIKDSNNNYVNLYSDDNCFCRLTYEYPNDIAKPKTDKRSKNKNTRFPRNSKSKQFKENNTEISTEKKSEKDSNIAMRKTLYITNGLDNTNLIKTYEYILDNNGNTTQTWFKNNREGYQKVDSVDSKQRLTFTAWYDLKGRPINECDTSGNGNMYVYHYGNSFHKRVTTFDDVHGIVTIQLFDKDEKTAYDEDRNYSKAVIINDSIKHTQTTYFYQDSTLFDAYVSHLDPVSGKVIQQYELTPSGEHARVAWGDALFYQNFSTYNYKGDNNGTYGRNEFGEPSYIRTLGTSEEAFCYYDIQNNRYLNENGEAITRMEGFIKQLPIAYCIEVTDTTKAFPLGLKSNDIIISYGNWTASDNLNTDMNSFYLETILQANSSKNITLLRHHPDKKSSEIIKTKLPIGKTSDLGFYPHKIYYTQKEAKRLQDTCNVYHVTLSSPVIEKDTTIWLAVQKKGSPGYTAFYHSPEIMNRDAGILLYANSDKEKWSIRKDAKKYATSVDEMDYDDAEAVNAAAAAAAEAVAELAEEAAVDTVAVDDNDYDATYGEGPLPSYFSNRTIFLTHDLNDLCSLKETEDDSIKGGLEIIPVKVSGSLLERILDFYALHSDMIPSDLDHDDYQAMSNPALTFNKLKGKWNTVAQINEYITADLTLQLDKKDQASCLMLLTWIFQDLGVELVMTYRSTPKWSLNGVCLEFDFHEANPSCELTTLEINDKELSEDDLLLYELYFNAFAERIKSRLKSDNFSLDIIFDEDYFVVKELGKKDMTVLDGDTERAFTKVK